ncbi:MAG TPA: hypothetical protein VFG00_04225 [Acidothermaceae bacterium]|nr:hypothetical protein [Acidothermaceae bacterium]
MTDRRDLWGGEPTMPIGAPPVALSDTFIAEQDRMRSTRAVAARGLQQRRWRRRVLPPLAVTSAALLGTGAAGAWVNAELTAKTAPPAAPDASGQLAALEQVRQQLSADQQALAAITVALRPSSPQTGSSLAATATTSAPAPGPTALPATRATSTNGGAALKPATVPRTAGPTTAAKPSKPAAAALTPVAKPPVARPTVAPPAPAPTHAPAPPPAQAPAPVPPPVHATTGASGAKP